MPQPPAPSSPPVHASRTLSLILVVLQFVLIALLVTSLADLVPHGLADLPGTLCLLGSPLLVASAFVAMQRRNFTVMPEPRRDSRLIERGPCARIRHPVYAAVLLGGLKAEPVPGVY